MTVRLVYDPAAIPRTSLGDQMEGEWKVFKVVSNETDFNVTRDGLLRAVNPE